MFYHLVAMGKNNQIGLNRDWPCYLKYFPQVTNEHTVIISRKMFGEYGHKYVARKFVVVSRSTIDLEAALASTQDDEHVFIVGGLSLFLQTINIVDGIYVARADGRMNDLTVYPQIPSDMQQKYSVKFDQDPAVMLQYYERDWDELKQYGLEEA